MCRRHVCPLSIAVCITVSWVACCISLSVKTEEVVVLYVTLFSFGVKLPQYSRSNATHVKNYKNKLNRTHQGFKSFDSIPYLFWCQVKLEYLINQL